MELAEYIRIFWKQRAVFVRILAGFLVAATLIFLFQPMRYRTEITMNVAREGRTAGTEYSYDDFYRLQADERFADTVVRWLQSPRIVSDIAKRADVSQPISFQADRLSSQVIRVRFATRDEDSAKRITRQIFSVLNDEAASLNAGDSKTAGWFSLVGDVPNVRDGRIGWGTVFGGGFLMGMFFGFFGTFLAEYFEEYRKRQGSA